MLLLQSGDKTVLQMFLRSVVNSVGARADSVVSEVAKTDSFPQGVKMAAVFAVMLPVMVVYPFLQKYFTKGILVGAVKM